MKSIILPSLIFLVAMPGTATTPLESAALDIARRSPAVIADRARIDATAEQLAADNSLKGPEVDFDYKFAAKKGIDNRWGFSVGQEFDWPGVYTARRQAARQQVGALELLYRQTLADKTFEARQALVDLVAARQRASLLAQVEKAYNELDSVYDRAYRRGEITVIDARKLKLQIFSCRVRLATEQAAAEAAEATVKALMAYGGTTIPEDIELPAVEKPAPYETYRAAMMQNNPGLKAMNTLCAAAASEVTVARRAALPSFKISYAHDLEENIHFNGFGLSISLPSWAPAKGVKAARARAIIAESEETDYRLRTMAELTNAYSTASKLANTLDGSNELFGDDYPALLLKSLNAGQMPLYKYLDEYGSFIDAKLEYINLRADYTKALGALQRYTIYYGD